MSPIMGRILDVTPNRMAVAGISCGVMMAGHLILGLSTLHPLVGLLILSVAESVLPTILRSSVPRAVIPEVAGLAYGIYAVAESLGKVVGNPLVGYFKDRTGGYTLDEIIFASMSGAAILMCVLISIVDGRRGGTLNQRAPVEASSPRNAQMPNEVVIRGEI
jgi:predicted MFS family arabinose efflux permease